MEPMQELPPESSAGPTTPVAQAATYLTDALSSFSGEDRSQSPVRKAANFVANRLKNFGLEEELPLPPASPSRSVSPVRRAAAKVAAAAGKMSLGNWERPKRLSFVEPTEGMLDGVPVGKVPEDPRQWQSFEFADDIESGMCGGLSATYITPPGDPVAEERLLVQDCLHIPGCCMLTTDANRPLLIARPQDHSRVYNIFIAKGGAEEIGGHPAFVLQGNEDRSVYTLTSLRCEQCEAKGARRVGTRELARYFQYCEHVAEAFAFCMDTELPRVLADGSPSVRCNVCGVPAMEEGELDLLTTIRPKWNPKRKTLTLSFDGRVQKASARNFQLRQNAGSDDRKLLFGLQNSGAFALDYKAPLGAVQAFAAALTTEQWKHETPESVQSQQSKS